MGKLKLTSPAFKDGDTIPRKYGYTKENVSPPLEISGVLPNAKSLVLVMDDPDAMEPAGKVWDHWVLWNIDPETKKIPEAEAPSGAEEGMTDYGERGYGGPNPPDREHEYRFKLYALDTTLELPSTASKKDVEKAMEGHILDETIFTGTYAP